MNHKIKLTQHTTPIRPGAQWPCGRGTAVGLLSSRREGLRPLPPTLPRSVDHAPTYQMYRVSFDSNLVLTGETAWKKKKTFLRYHQDTAGTPPEHHRNTTKTWAEHPKNDRTSSRHYGHTTKMPPRHQQPPKHYSETTKTPAVQTPSGQTPPIPEKPAKGVSQKVAASYQMNICRVYCGRYIGATGDRLLKKHLQVDICRCKVADVKTQVGINFLKSTYNMFSKFSRGASGQRGLMSTKRNPHETSIVIHWDQIAMWVCAVSTLSHEMRLDRQKLWVKLRSCMFAEPFRTKCVSAIGNHVKVRLCKNVRR